MDNINILKFNVDKLAKLIKNSIKESTKSLSTKPCSVTYTILVQEDKLNCTQPRDTLAEAVADLEEILQFHRPEHIKLNSILKDPKDNVLSVVSVSCSHIKERGPLQVEGKTLFRFKKNADLFAEELNRKGLECELVSHPWGTAVNTLATNESVGHAYESITERKWIKKALNPDNRGDCTPMTKSTCTPAKKALAKRFKKGGDLYSGDNRHDNN